MSLLPLFLILLPTIYAEFNCPNDGSFASEENCSSYYQCLEGEAFLSFCPSGTFWDQKTESCLQADQKPDFGRFGTPDYISTTSSTKEVI